MIEELQEESYLYNLLSQLFLPEPSEGLLRGLAAIAIPDADDHNADKGLRILIQSSQDNAQRLYLWREELVVEYTRLFIGPKSPPAVPFASFYLSDNRALMTNETIEVRKKYMESGMGVINLYQVPDDHLAIELEFVSYLTKQALDAARSGDIAAAQSSLTARNEFISGHLRLWVPTFADKILENTGEDFFMGTAYLLKGAFVDIP